MQSFARDLQRLRRTRSDHAGAQEIPRIRWPRPAAARSATEAGHRRRSNDSRRREIGVRGGRLLWSHPHDFAARLCATWRAAACQSAWRWRSPATRPGRCSDRYNIVSDGDSEQPRRSSRPDGTIQEQSGTVTALATANTVKILVNLGASPDWRWRFCRFPQILKLLTRLILWYRCCRFSVVFDHWPEVWPKSGLSNQHSVLRSLLSSLAQIGGGVPALPSGPCDPQKLCVRQIASIPVSA